MFTCRWGILATGGIATKFVKDLLLDPKTRDVADVKHEVVAAASSSSKTRAEEFISGFGLDTSKVACYGNYEELVNDKNVDIIYVATPHGLHYDNVKLALNAGKHVLCEKAFTVNEQQAAHLIRMAQEKNLFLMEAVWTRFFPLSKTLQKLLFKDRILGKLLRVSADNCIPFDVNTLPLSHRMLDPKLAGGALLDLGIYALTWIFMIAYNDPDNGYSIPQVTSTMVKNKRTQVDETTNMNLMFPGSGVNCVATTSMCLRTSDECVCRIEGEKGVVTVQWAPFRPESFTVYLNRDFFEPGVDVTKKGFDKEGEKQTFEIPGQGMFWEADECARCIRDGKKESKVMPLEESRVIMSVMDKVRRDNHFYYPPEIEKCDY